MNKSKAWYIGLSVNVLLALTFISGGAWYFTQKPTPEPAQATAPRTTTLELPKPKPALTRDGLYAQVSLNRIRAGLAPLTVNPLLEQSACLKAQDMVTRNYWSHNAPDGTQPWYFFEQAGYPYARAGENLLYGTYYRDESAVTAWMNSESHRANILGDYQETGICVLTNIKYQGSDNTNLAVQHFGTQ